MRTGLAKRLRALLREHHDGLSVPAMASMVSADVESVRRRLKEMPDAYIDRWQKSPGNYVAIWCVVVPPPNCPRPER